MDSQIDLDHEDLKSKIWVNDKEIPGNKVDDDKNGYIDDVNGLELWENLEVKLLNIGILIVQE